MHLGWKLSFLLFFLWNQGGDCSILLLLFASRDTPITLPSPIKSPKAGIGGIISYSKTAEVPNQ